MLGWMMASLKLAERSLTIFSLILLIVLLLWVNLYFGLPPRVITETTTIYLTTTLYPSIPSGEDGFNTTIIYLKDVEVDAENYFKVEESLKKSFSDRYIVFGRDRENRDNWVLLINGTITPSGQTIQTIEEITGGRVEEMRALTRVCNEIIILPIIPPIIDLSRCLP